MRNDFLNISIGAAEEGLTVKQVLRGKLRFSAHQLSRVKYRPEGILVNGVPRWVNAVLHAGDVLRIRLDDPQQEGAGAAQQVSFGTELPGTAGAGLPGAGSPPEVSCENGTPGIPILYEDDYLLIAAKPAGMVSHPSHGHHGDSALDLLAAGRGTLYLIGRLDKDTSGALLFAKHLETASVLSRARREGGIEKEYLARIRGAIEPAEGRIAAPIGTAQEFPLKMRVDAEHGKAAVTHYQTVFTGPGTKNGEAFSILSVRIDHGRTHQIRVHLSAAGHPLEGDALYGSAEPCSRFPGACLHAASIRLLHPYTGAEISVSAPLPEWCPAEL